MKRVFVLLSAAIAHATVPAWAGIAFCNNDKPGFDAAVSIHTFLGTPPLVSRRIAVR